MTFLEKKSFYSFLVLYIVSSSLFIILSGYWYYSGQKNALSNVQYHTLEHSADVISRNIIYAHMQGVKFELPLLEDELSIALIDTKNRLKYGTLIDKNASSKIDYYRYKNYNILVSDAPQEHLNIKYVVVQSNVLYSQLDTLKINVLLIIFLSILVMVILAFVLSKLFMRPINQKIKQIEDFISDTAHELNTPITALKMSVSSALNGEPCDKKTLKNISISTKQLFDIYNALSYLSFDQEEEKAVESIDICAYLQKSISYYEELAHRKRIEFIVECDSYHFKIDETKITMLFGNLINNAIKYSHANSKIKINLHAGVLKIQDYGIGISEEGISKIFERFNRETNYSGGFGIGLSIVKKISEEYKLKLSVDSKLEEGSCFTVDFS